MAIFNIAMLVYQRIPWNTNTSNYVKVLKYQPIQRWNLIDVYCISQKWALWNPNVNVMAWPARPTIGILFADELLTSRWRRSAWFFWGVGVTSQACKRVRTPACGWLSLTARWDISWSRSMLSLDEFWKGLTQYQSKTQIQALLQSYSSTLNFLEHHHFL